MNLLELAKSRRSVRKYSSKKVSRDQIDRCLEVARLAPSACNSQPWSFVVIEDKLLKTNVAKQTALPGTNINSFANEPPAIIALIAEKPNISANIGAFLKNRPFYLMDIGIAAEHFCLQAAEEGLGTCMIGWFHERKIKRILKLPFYKRIALLITLGYPADDSTQEKIRKPLKSIVKYI